MLIENKFIYVSLPRCASTAFMSSCMKYNLNIKHFKDIYNIENQIKKYKIDINQVDYTHFDKFGFDHAHEPLNGLKDKFGHSFDVISVKRNKYERFVSLWQHVLKMLYFIRDIDTFNKCTKLSVDDILFYKTNDIQSADSVELIVQDFIKKHKLNSINEKGKEMLATFITPYSRWHNHDTNIIWFDFNELNKLEEWVSEKLNIDFKLIRMNSSQHFSSELKLTDSFKEKYDSIYFYYDEVKNVKTLF